MGPYGSPPGLASAVVLRLSGDGRGGPHLTYSTMQLPDLGLGFGGEKFFFLESEFLWGHEFLFH
jgi:hypothetical protein